MASEEAKTAYELERDERIARNRKVLADMGVADAWAEAYKSRRKQKSIRVKREAKEENKQGPPRKSARLHPDLKKEFEASFMKHGDETMLRRKAVTVPAKRLAELEETDAEAVYRHNLMRLNSMSDAAMERRIKKIRRVDKMESLILVLKDAQRGDLLQLAQEALRELQ